MADHAGTRAPRWDGDTASHWRGRHADPYSQVWAVVPPAADGDSWRLYPPGFPTDGVPAARTRGNRPGTDPAAWDLMWAWVERATHYRIGHLALGWPWPGPHDPADSGQARVIYAYLTPPEDR